MIASFIFHSQGDGDWSLHSETVPEGYIPKIRSTRILQGHNCLLRRDLRNCDTLCDLRSNKTKTDGAERGVPL